MSVQKGRGDSLRFATATTNFTEVRTKSHTWADTGGHEVAAPSRLQRSGPATRGGVGWRSSNNLALHPASQEKPCHGNRAALHASEQRHRQAEAPACCLQS